MDPQAPASFIPKKSLTEGAGSGSRGSAFGFVFLIAILLFFASVVAAGASFLYGTYLNKSLTDKSASLEKDKDAYSPAALQDLYRLDSRIQNSSSLLQKHIAPSAIFDYLGSQTLENVQFDTFAYHIQPDGSAAVSLNGQAVSFATVALQSDQFSASKIFKDVVFAGVSANQDNKINFTVTFDVDASLLNFGKSLTGSTAVPVTPPPTSGSTTPTGTVLPPL